MNQGRDKRKRAEKERESKKMKGMERDEEEEEKGRYEAEEEEEVEEFFAILRRMQVAVKYFERGNNGEGWRSAVESLVGDGGHEEKEKEEEEEEVVVVIKCGDGKDIEEATPVKEEEEEVEKGALDLNTVPPVKG